MPQLATAVWQNRWQALDDALNGVIQQQTNDTIAATAECLRAFGADQFTFFLDGFQDGTLLPSMYHPAEYVLRATLDQVGYDLAVLQQAAGQRQLQAQQQALATGERLAQSALNIALEAGMLPESAPLTYLNKSPNIRVIPYAPVALVAIPYSSMTTPRDFLAIPHEVGHYVYKHAPGLAAHLHQHIPLDPPWFNNWLEEIFADVFGCLVAGPVIGIDFQDLLIDNPTARFNFDDGEHPVDALRPYIYITALEALGFHNAADALTKRWQRLEQQRNAPDTFVAYDSGEQVHLAAAQVKLEAVVRKLLDYLLDTYQFNNGRYWTADLAAGEDDAETLYQAFETWLHGTADPTPNELKQQGKKVGVVLPDGSVVNKRKPGEALTWRDLMKKKCRKETYSLTWPAWFPIFTAGFWPTKGPEGNSDDGL